MVVPPAVISMTRGDTKEINITVKRNGAPLPITGMTMWLTAKRDVSDADPGVFQLTNTSGAIVFSNPSGGVAVATILPTHTSGLEDQEVDLSCDVQIKDTSNRIRTVSRFTLRVSPDITRTT